MNDMKQTENFEPAPAKAGVVTPVTKEAAAKLVDDLLDFYDVDIMDIEDENAQKSHAAACNRIKRAVAKGRLEIKEENGFPVVYQHLQHPVAGLKTLRYRAIDGAAKMRTKDMSGNAYGRMYALLAALAGAKTSDVAQMIGQDVSIAEALSGVFLGV